MLQALVLCLAYSGYISGLYNILDLPHFHRFCCNQTTLAIHASRRQQLLVSWWNSVKGNLTYGMDECCRFLHPFHPGDTAGYFSHRVRGCSPCFANASSKLSW